MGLLSTEYNTLQELFVDEVKDIYDAEKRICEALPDMIESAHCHHLKEAFQSHLQETQGHCARLERVFSALGMEADRKTCAGIKGILGEGSDMAKAKGDPHVHDAGLIAAAQRVEHYEMAVYGTLRTFAEQLGMADAALLFQQTLDEEELCDEKLTEIALDHVNAEAQHAMQK